MKKTAIFIFTAFLLSVLNSACDPCKKKDCGPYGNCIDGTCDCDCGASKGSDGKCNVNDRDPFIGAYVASGTSSSGGNFSNFDFRCNALGASFNLIEFDMSEIGFPKFKGTKQCDEIVTFDIANDGSTGDKYNGSAARTGNILTIIIRRTTSIGSEITYTFTGNKK